MFDDKDAKILEVLQENARATNVDLARALGLTPSATLDRVRKLEERGLIKGYSAQLSAEGLGLPLLAFVFARVEESGEAFGAAESVAAEIANLTNVLEVHHLAGEDCLLIKVRARDTNDLYGFLSEELGRFRQIRSTRTTIVLKTKKESPRLPVIRKASEQ